MVGGEDHFFAADFDFDLTTDLRTIWAEGQLQLGDHARSWAGGEWGQMLARMGHEPLGQGRQAIDASQHKAVAQVEPQNEGPAQAEQQNSSRSPHG